MRALVDEFAVAQGGIACRWFRGWADARMGEPREGYRQIRGAYEENTRLGMLAGGARCSAIPRRLYCSQETGKRPSTNSRRRC
jgi:hypothetical protein